MMLRSRLALSFVIVATAAFAAGCSDDSSHESVMRVTLTGDSCRYEGTTTPPGTFAIDVRNDTNKPASFALVMLPKDATLKDVQTRFDQAFKRWQKTGKYVLRRPMSWYFSAHVAPHAASELPANVSAGRWAVLCVRGNPYPPADATASAELDVTSDG